MEVCCQESMLLGNRGNGAVPKGMCVFKLDGDAYNNDISNLCLVTRKDLAQLNRNYNKIPQELKEVQILVNQIKQKTKWRTKLAIYEIIYL